MILLIGGKYQGKLDFACDKYGISRKDVYNCTREKVEMDYEKRVLNNVEELVYACLANGRDPLKYLAARKSRWINSVIIVNDISCGLVPMDTNDRIFREAVGRTSMYLAMEAKEVFRIFAGLPMKLK